MKSYFENIIPEIEYKPQNNRAKLRNNLDKFGVILYFLLFLFYYFDMPMNAITIYL